MFDLKNMHSALSQLEEERGIPREKMIEAVEMALATAYKKDYGKKSQIIRANFDINSGNVSFSQIKIVVDKSMLKEEETGSEIQNPNAKGQSLEAENMKSESELEDKRVHFNEDHHILLEDARKIKKDVQAGEELVFPLEVKDDFGRIAAQTAKQVIIQRIREAEKVSVLEEFGKRQGQILSGKVQRIERGNVYVDLGRAVGLLAREEQIPGEHYTQGERIKAFLYQVEESPRGISLRLSRSHPQFIVKLFEVETPEIADGVVVIESIAREAGSRTKIAVSSRDQNIDPVGSCVGQRGVRVSTVINEIGGEKIDIIEYSKSPELFITQALSPAKINSIVLDEANKQAKITVDEDQFSLAIGKGGQNVRLAAKLTGWKIDIHSNAPVDEIIKEE